MPAQKVHPAWLLALGLGVACGGAEAVPGQRVQGGEAPVPGAIASAGAPAQAVPPAVPASASDPVLTPPSAMNSSGEAKPVSSGECVLGAAGSFATDQQLNLFGEVVYFAGGQALPAGRYRVTYLDGCMKYNAFFPWTVNSSGGSDGWWLVRETSSDRLRVLPGPGFALPFEGYQSFAECVDAGRAIAPVEVDFAGGRLGVWLADAPYDDNQAGENGRNPKWGLSLLVETCPPDIDLQ